MAKLHDNVKKYSPMAQVERATIGDKAWDQAHFIGTSLSKKRAAEKEAKSAAKSAEADAARMRQIQFQEMADLNDEENRRIKKMLMGAFGTRMYRGAPLTRAAASNTRGGPLALAAAGGVAATPTSPVLRSSGARGGASHGARVVTR